jgi:CIC family chloride channel protein
MSASPPSKKWLAWLNLGSTVDVAHAGKWALYFIAIGLIAGLGSVVFHYLCQLGIHYLMDFMAGYRPPVPAGEHHLLPSTTRPFNRWILLFLPAAGGLVSGWLVYTFAPEAEGHGTDAAINAYHNKGGLIRNRVPLIKTLASAVTLASGGSGGREGPIAQIGAGFGSFLATSFKLTDRDRRIMMAAGVGAGIGSIFRAPLAGALFAAEVLYRDPEFESEVIIPAGISSVVAYCVFCLVFGWGSLFESPPFKFQNPLELGPYLILALILVGLGIIYVKMFYGTVKFFYNIKTIPNHFKPAIGGLATGLIGFFWPQCLAFGYGFAQKALYLERFSDMTIGFLVILAFGKILTTSFTIGSGGSGGVFGPSIVIGGAMGGAVGKLFNQWMPNIVSEPGAFVVVGMAGFFTAVSNTPISTIIFVSEMTNSYHLLLPSLLVCSVAYLAAKRWTIYNQQVKSKIDSPAHAGDFFVDVLQSYKVQDVLHMVKKVRLVPQEMPFLEFRHYFSTTTQHYFPVMDGQGRMVSIFSINDVRGVLFSPEIEHLVVMKDIGTSEMIVATPSDDLNSVLKMFTTKNLDSLPVVEEEDHGRLIGMLNRREVISFYNSAVEQMRSSIHPQGTSTRI